MFRLTRQVRFALGDAGAVPARGGNGFAGVPPLVGFGIFLMLDVTLEGELEPASGYLRNIKDIDDAVRRIVLPHLSIAARDHAPPARSIGEVFGLLQDAWPPARLARLSLHLSPFLGFTVDASELPMTRIHQRFEFSASHRLHNPALSDSDNRRCFGKCNNPHGHGHNYELQVTLRGQPDSNGLLIDIPRFEQIVAEAVIVKFDHKNLNQELAEFRDVNPSVENIARVIFRLLRPRFTGGAGELASVTVWETPKTWCEYAE